MVRILIDVDSEWKKQLKIDAIENEMTMKDYIMLCVDEKRDRDVQDLINASVTE